MAQCPALQVSTVDTQKGWTQYISLEKKKKKKVISLFGIQNDSVNQKNDSKILYLLSEEDENTTLSNFIESLTKAAVLFFFPVRSGSVPLWLSIFVTNMMLIKTLETEILLN